MSATPITLIGSPYHLGQRDVSMGNGPRFLLADDQLPARLRASGLDADVRWVDADEPGPADRLVPGDQMCRQLVQCRDIAALVAKARQRGRKPILSVGNCHSSIGVLSGLNLRNIGVVWLDAHADAETPETSESGLFDGMPVATIAGRCWQAWASCIPGFRSVSEDNIVMVSLHSLDAPAGDGQIVGHRNVTGVAVDRPALQRIGYEKALADALDALARRDVTSIYLHIDLDVLDENEGRSSVYTSPGGLSVAEVKHAIATVNQRFDVEATTFSAYDPDVDPRMKGIAVEIAATAAMALQRQR